MIWPDITSLAVRLSIVGWNAKFSGPGIPAKIVVEGMILLADYQNMVNRFGTGRGCWRDRWDPATRPKCQADSRHGPKFSQYAPPRLTRIDQLVEIHKFPLPYPGWLQSMPLSKIKRICTHVLPNIRIKEAGRSTLNEGSFRGQKSVLRFAMDIRLTLMGNG